MDKYSETALQFRHPYLVLAASHFKSDAQVQRINAMAKTFKFKSFIPPSHKPQKPMLRESAAKERAADAVVRPAVSGRLSAGRKSEFEIHETQDITSLDSTNLVLFDHASTVSEFVSDTYTTTASGGGVYSENISSLAPPTPLISEGQGASHDHRQNEGIAAPMVEDEHDEIPPIQIDPSPNEDVLYTCSDAERPVVMEYEADPDVQSITGAAPIETGADRGASPCNLTGAGFSPATQVNEACLVSPADPKDEGFQDWLAGRRAQGTVPSSKRTQQLLEEYDSDSDLDNGQPSKRPRFAPTESPNTLPNKPQSRRLYAILAGNNGFSDEEFCQSPSCYNHEADRAICDTDPLAATATALLTKPKANPTAASPAYVVSPPASILSDAPCTSRKAGTPAAEEVQTAHSCRKRPFPMRAEDRPTLWSSETKGAGENGGCSSCAIFRAALLEALFLLQRPLAVDAWNETWQDRVSKDTPERSADQGTLRNQHKGPTKVVRSSSSDTDTGGVNTELSRGKECRIVRDTTRWRNNRNTRSTFAQTQREDVWKTDRLSYADLRDGDSVASDSSVEVTGTPCSGGRSVSKGHAAKELWQGRLLKANLPRRNSQHSKSKTTRSQRISTQKVDSQRLADVDYESVNGDSSRYEDDGSDCSSVQDDSGGGDLGTRRRRWTELEVCRLRAWKREGKTESWIAARLDRTESAVKQQWRKMTEK